MNIEPEENDLYNQIKNDGQNQELQNSTVSDIISNEQGGVEDGQIYNQGRVYGSVEETDYTGRKNQTTKNSATVDEYVTGGKGEILSGSTGKTQRRIRINHTKNSSVTFTEGTEDGTDGYKAYTAFVNAGIKAIYCQGTIERTVNGNTVTRTEAFTAPDGTVYVSSESSLPPKQTFDHEMVHVAEKNVDYLIKTAREYNESKYKNADNNEQGVNSYEGISDQGRLDEKNNIDAGRKSQISQSRSTLDEYVTGGKAEVISGGQGEVPRRILINHTKNSSVTFTEGTADDTNGYKAYTAFANAGVKVIYCQGPIERTVNGNTVARTEAFTAPDGTVYVSSESSLPPKQTFDHEIIHIADKTNNPAYADYESVLYENADYSSDTYKEIVAKINRNQFNNKYDIDDIDSYPIFMREIAAYINQFVLSDPEFADSTFGGMFSDWGAVVEAVNKFNTDMEADLNGSADFMPGGETDNTVAGRKDGDIAEFNGIDTVKSKHLNKAQQDEIFQIGKELGRKVIFEDFYLLDKFKGKKIMPDGYIDGNGNVHINYYAKRPVYFLFKHEITHYLKRTLASYNDFMNLVIESNAFKDWLNKKGYSSIDTLKTEIMNTYSEVKGFDESQCYDEILANFVGEYLFSGENAVSEKLINALEPPKRKTFKDVIKDIINYFKEKFQKNKSIQTEIQKIENEFIKVYNQAVEQKNTADNGGVRYSFAGERAVTADKSLFETAKQRTENGEDSETVRRETGWFKGYDGKWRFEIDDSDVEMLENNIETHYLSDGEMYRSAKLEDVIDHIELFASYPQLKDYTVIIQETEPGVEGSFHKKGKQIVINQELFTRISDVDEFLNKKKNEIRQIENTPEFKEYNKFYEGEYANLDPAEWLELEKIARDKFYNSEIGKRYYELNWGKSSRVKKEIGWSKQAKAVLLHEVQHAIQEIEGFASGASTNNLNYYRVAGEIESRDVEKRLNYSAEQRKNTRPDIDRTDVVFVDGSVSSFLSKGNKSDSKRLIQLIQENINEIPKNNLYDISGDGIIDGVKSRYILDIFDMQGNTAYRKDLGTIELTENGAESTIFHGFGKNKLIAAKGIKNVIENGKIISKIENYQNKGNTRYVIAGYGTINNLDSIMAVAINEYVAENGRKSFYLHEIVIKNKDASPFMAEQQKTVSAGKASFDTTVPQKAQSVNNNISKNGEEYSVPNLINFEELLEKYENGEITKEEYLERTDELWGKANEKYGVIEQGENPTLNIAVPKGVEDGKYTSGLQERLLKQGKLPGKC